MKKLLNILAVASVFILLSITACQPGEAPDDIIGGPGGPAYRANFHQQGEENPWPPIKANGVDLGDDTDAAHIAYRDYIETKAGQVRNNIFTVSKPDRNLNHVVVLEVSNIPTYIEVTEARRWYGPGIVKTVLEIEISRQVKPGEYNFEVGVKIDGRDYGTVPCTIKVIE